LFHIIYLKQVSFHHLMLFREADGGPGGIMWGFTFGDRILRGIIELGGDFLCEVEELGQEAIYYLIHRVIVLGFYFSTAKLMRGCPKSQDTL
jgi:hypothetical protein